MSKSLLDDAFAHHVWATLRVIDACSQLTPEQLETTVPGTYGSIIETLRHTVGADSWYLFRVSGERTTPISEEDGAQADLVALRSAMEDHGALWPTILAQGPDPDADVATRRDDGSEAHASVGLRLAQALHHGTDHRSQICTALTTLGIEPPEIDLWAYGETHGRITLVPAAT